MVMTRNVGKRVDIELSSCSEGSSRRLLARQHNVVADEVNLHIIGENSDGQSAGGNAIIQIDRLTAVDFAVKLLEALAPQRLAEVKFRDTTPGTYLRNRTTGRVVKVVPWSKEYAKFGDQTDSVVAAIEVGGDKIVPWQDPDKDLAEWEVVEVEEKTVTAWVVK